MPLSDLGSNFVGSNQIITGWQIELLNGFLRYPIERSGRHILRGMGRGYRAAASPIEDWVNWNEKDGKYATIINCLSSIINQQLLPLYQRDYDGERLSSR
jgi:hypothetical protein